MLSLNDLLPVAQTNKSFDSPNSPDAALQVRD
jgi:hypothetical protein